MTHLFSDSSSMQNGSIGGNLGNIIMVRKNLCGNYGGMTELGKTEAERLPKWYVVWPNERKTTRKGESMMV